MKSSIPSMLRSVVGALAIFGLATAPTQAANTDEAAMRYLIQYQAGNLQALSDVIEANGGKVVFDYSALLEGLAADLSPAGIRAVRPAIPVATPITAGLEGLARFEARKIAVLTPYIDDVNGPMVRYIQDRGLDVVALTSFLVADDNVMARIPPQAIYEAALEADRPEADALFISCTALRAVDVVERIEQVLDKPVITANQALFWQALRAAGYHAPVQGYGRLLRLPT